MTEFEAIRAGDGIADPGQPRVDQAAQPTNDLARIPTTRSRASSRRRELERIYSAQHLDDHGYYHHDDHSSSDDEDYSEEVREKEEQEEQDQNASSDTAKDDDSSSREEAEVRGGIANVRDVEKGVGHKKSSKSLRSNKSKDPNLVTWDGPDDPANPKNWTMKRKALGLLTVAMFTFISPVSSSMVAPSIQAISAEFGITDTVVQQMTLSIFVLAYAVGPLFLGPLSEIYGRVLVLQLSNLIYLIFDAACGGARNTGMMIAFRLLSGLGGSAPLAIGGGVLSDMFTAEQRGRAVAIYSLMPLLGPAIGPIAGGFITLNTTWRWSFYATAIADAAIQVAGLFLLRETYAPVILGIKAKKLRKETGNSALHTQFEHPDRTLGKVIRTAVARPFRLISTQPIVIFLAVYMAYLYGLMYLVLSTFPTLFQETYHENVGIAGLNYISLAVGFFLGTQISAPLNDRFYRVFKAKYGEGRPEFRVPMMIPGSLLVPAGLFLYGWSAQYATHWIVPNIGAALFAAGTIIGFQCIQTYLIDSYTRFAASAVAAATVLRSLAGFGFPLFAPYMYAALGYGWGNSLLGFIALAVGVPAPFVLWFFGAKLRAKSSFAAGA